MTLQETPRASRAHDQHDAHAVCKREGGQPLHVEAHGCRLPRGADLAGVADGERTGGGSVIAAARMPAGGSERSSEARSSRWAGAPPLGTGGGALHGTATGAIVTG